MFCFNELTWKTGKQRVCTYISVEVLLHTRRKHILQDEGEEEIREAAFWVAFLLFSKVNFYRETIHLQLDWKNRVRQTGKQPRFCFRKAPVGWATWRGRGLNQLVCKKPGQHIMGTQLLEQACSVSSASCTVYMTPAWQGLVMTRS